MPKTNTINGYYAHIYYTDDASLIIDERIRKDMKSKFYVVSGCWKKVSVNPHTKPVYEIGVL